MKIERSGEIIRLKSLCRKSSDLNSHDVTRVVVWAQKQSYALLASLLPASFREVKLRFIIVEFNSQDHLTFDAFRDKGFNEVVPWLEITGWDLSKAIEKALRTPLIRVEAYRT